MSYRTYLSIVIPAYNKAGHLSVNLPRIKDALNAAIPPKFPWKIIVGDDNSLDDTAEIDKQEDETVVFEPIPQISRARNTGVTATSSE